MGSNIEHHYIAAWLYVFKDMEPDLGVVSSVNGYADLIRIDLLLTNDFADGRIFILYRKYHNGAWSYNEQFC